MNEICRCEGEAAGASPGNGNEGNRDVLGAETGAKVVLE